MFTTFWARSAKWGRNRGLGLVPDVGFFLSAIPDDFSATSQRPIFTRFGHDTWIVVETQILDRHLWKVSIQGSFALETPNLEGVKQGPQSRLQVKVCTAEILFTPRCSPRAREFLRSVSFFVRRTVAELPGVKVAQFSDFGLLSPYKTGKKYLPVTSLQPRGYITEWSQFSCVIVKGQKGCLPAARFSYDFW